MRAAAPLLLLLGCGGTDLYEACDDAEQCTAPAEGLEAECVDGDGADAPGFCTWSCEVDADCTEPTDDSRLVCASFESSEGKHCFPGCDDVPEGEEPCPSGLECASTGGGDENRKVCKPPT